MLFETPSEFNYKIKCPKCGILGLVKYRTGKRKEDYAWWCMMCEDGIAKESVIHIEC